MPMLLYDPALTLTHSCHGRPTGRAEGPPEDRLRPATHDFAGGNCKSRGWPGQTGHDTWVTVSAGWYYLSTATVGRS